MRPPAAVSSMTEPAPGLKPGSTILVTGASGWVGGVLCQQLRERGFAVKAAVRDPAAAKCEFLSTMGCELVRVPDLLSDEGWSEAMAGCDGLAHVASPVVLGAVGDEAAIISQAVEGTERALEFAAKAGTVKRVVVTATMASVCGTQREKDPESVAAPLELRVRSAWTPHPETVLSGVRSHLWSEADKNDLPGTAYSKSKTAAEARTWELAALHADKYSVTTVHPAVVLGCAARPLARPGQQQRRRGAPPCRVSPAAHTWPRPPLAVRGAAPCCRGRPSPRPWT